MTVLIGEAAFDVAIVAAESVETPPFARDEKFRLDRDNLLNGWATRSRMFLPAEHWITGDYWEEPDASWGGPTALGSGAFEEVLVGGYVPTPGLLSSHDYKGAPSWYRDDLFRLDTPDLKSGWAPRTAFYAHDTTLIESQWWEDWDGSWHGPNYAPNAETLRGPSWSRTLSAAAALAIYDSP